MTMYSYNALKIHSSKYPDTILTMLKKHLVFYPTPVNLTYFWNYGSLAGIILGIQIVTGIFLAMYYQPSADYAFASVEHVMRDVNNGWLIRYLHANGASFFFMIVYLHISRGLYYTSYTSAKPALWMSGVAIFLIMMATAFIGYVLPFGQMSLWGSVVITNLVSAIPLVGQDIVYWIWGGFSVGNATINRFFAIHYLLPFIIAVLAIIHIYFLHNTGSSNPFPLEHRRVINQQVNFSTYFSIKDTLGLLIFLFVYMIFVSYMPNYMGHSDNYIEANPMVTPEHIVPEWYFLPFYAILRSIPNKIGGIIAMGGAIVLVMLIPVFAKFVKEHLTIQTQQQIFLTKESAESKTIYWVLVFTFLILGWIGGKPVEEPYVTIGLISTIIYFSAIFILILYPLVELFGRGSISDSSRKQV